LSLAAQVVMVLIQTAGVVTKHQSRMEMEMAVLVPRTALAVEDFHLMVEMVEVRQLLERDLHLSMVVPVVSDRAVLAEAAKDHPRVAVVAVIKEVLVELLELEAKTDLDQVTAGFHITPARTQVLQSEIHLAQVR
jgi:hypothetical protein